MEIMVDMVMATDTVMDMDPEAGILIMKKSGRQNQLGFLGGFLGLGADNFNGCDYFSQLIFFLGIAPAWLKTWL